MAAPIRNSAEWLRFGGVPFRLGLAREGFADSPNANIEVWGRGGKQVQVHMFTTTAFDDIDGTSSI